jgi:Zn-dependent peptidase ImmA (M78 family)
MRAAELAEEALDKTLEVREEVDIPFGTPLNIYDLCERLSPKVRVRFTAYSMEGCYFRSDRPHIEVSALRPFGRRAFNAAHELGHHVFGHGSQIDELQDEGRSDPNDPNEILANAFARYLLMPKLAVRHAFVARGWQIGQAEPEQVFAIACHFGVGYVTLVNQLSYGLRELNSVRGDQLRKVALSVIRKSLLGASGSDRLWIADRHYSMQTLDTEVGTTLILPAQARSEFDHIEAQADLPSGRVFTAVKPGLTRVEAANGWAVVVRVSKYQYSGWSTNRHLEPEDDDDDE